MLKTLGKPVEEMAGERTLRRAGWARRPARRSRAGQRHKRVGLAARTAAARVVDRNVHDQRLQFHGEKKKKRKEKDQEKSTDYFFKERYFSSYPGQAAAVVARAAHARAARVVNVAHIDHGAFIRQDIKQIVEDPLCVQN